MCKAGDSGGAGLIFRLLASPAYEIQASRRGQGSDENRRQRQVQHYPEVGVHDFAHNVVGSRRIHKTLALVTTTRPIWLIQLFDRYTGDSQLRKGEPGRVIIETHGRVLS